jgi:serine/threonine protein kinase
MSDGGHFSERRAAKYVGQLISALRRCHKFNVVHRDIKPENLLLSSSDDLLLADFGWTVKNVHENKRTTLCGTLDYLAPEMLEDKAYDTSVDVWAVGVLLYEFIVGSTPFFAAEQSDTCRAIEASSYKIPDHVSPEASDLIRKLLQKDPQRRISLKDALAHPWFAKHARRAMR